MEALMDYTNHEKSNFIVKSAVAHLWFESIHPYDDGNGRIGRAITNYILSKDGGLDNRCYSISSAINQDRQGYYDALENAQRLKNSLNITEWVIWHTQSIAHSITFSIGNIQNVIVKTKFFDKINTVKLNEKQLKVINKLLDVSEGQFEGGLTNKKYRGLTKTSAVTASRHLKDMLDKGVIREIAGFSGRSSKYELNLN
ncbi:MAG: Fic family protein [Sulfurovum sp.]|nr:Fic family protein [Sulfurovum sp.]